MGNRLSSFGAVLVTLPLAVAVRVPQTESETTVSLEGGGGSYVSIVRDCSGRVIEKNRYHFEDAALEVARWQRPYRFGLRCGWAMDDRLFWDPDSSWPRRARPRGFYYGQPFVAVEKPSVGLTLGAVIAEKAFFDRDGGPNETTLHAIPSGRLRLGNPQRLAFCISVLDNSPIYSGGGAVDLGLAKQTDHHGVYVGLSGGWAYEGVGLLVKTDHDLMPQVTLHLNGRLGTNESEPEYGVSGGATFRFGQSGAVEPR